MVAVTRASRRRTAMIGGLMLGTALGGCASFPQLDAPARVPDRAAESGVIRPSGPVSETQLQSRIERLSKPEAPPAVDTAEATAEQAAAILGTGEVNAALPPQTLPEFIRAAFQDVLGMSVGLGPDTGTRNDVVAMATPASSSKVDFFLAVQRTLKSYGLKVYLDGNFALVTDSPEGSGGNTTYFTRSRTLADSIPNSRQVVLYFPLNTLEAPALEALVRDLGDRPGSVRIQSDPGQNALILSGPARDIRQFLSFLREVDRPLYENMRVARIRPAYWAADVLARQMVEVLKAEGISAFVGTAARRGVTFVPIAVSNQLLVFAEDEAVFEKALDWIERLDSAANFGDAQNLFVYQVRNTSAETLARVLTGQGGAQQSRGQTPNQGGNNPAQGTPNQPAGGGGNQGFNAGPITVDTAGNRILFRGTATDYERLLNTINLLDVPTKQVLFEVTIAEVTLTDATRFGIEWFAADRSGDYQLSGGTEDGLELGGSGFSLTVTGAKARAALNALASNNKVNILSTPRLTAQSGGEASIQLGTDIPIITSQRATDTQTDANTDILQSVEYRQTGIQLTIKPIVYADDRIEFEIQQEVSSATGSTSAATSNPIILNRTVSTRLTSREGMTTVIGGLMSENFSKSNSGIPFLKDVPLVGSAFRTDTIDGTKTELLILVTPRLMREDDTNNVNNDLIASMNQTLRLSRGSSYTLTPLATGISIGGGRVIDPRDRRPEPLPRDRAAGSGRPPEATTASPVREPAPVEVPETSGNPD